MRELERLIEELCPDGVEIMKLGIVADFGVGQAPLVNHSGTYSFVNAGTTPSGYLSCYNTEPDTVTTPSRGQGGIGFVGYQSAPFWCGPLCYRIRGKKGIMETRYLYFAMANSVMTITGLANMTGVPALNRKELSELPIPVPPLPVQREIVRILDNFTELTAELTARKKQYEYYRNELLTFGDDVPMVPIDAACEDIFSGKNKKRDSNGTYSVYGSTGIIGYSDTYAYDHDTILIARVGANCGYIHLCIR